jgi:hypothetical protein
MKTALQLSAKCLENVATKGFSGLIKKGGGGGEGKNKNDNQT